MSRQRNRDISLYDFYYTEPICTKPCKKPSRCAPNQTIDLCNIRELRKNKCYQDPCYIKCSKPVCKKTCASNQAIDLCNIRELKRCYQDPCYVKCSKYNKCCQCIQCNNKYNACYQKCQHKCREQSNTYINNICHCERCYKNNTVAQPLSQCLFATTGVIYPLVNNMVHPCQFNN
jgi:hypothetical protein